MEDWIINPLRNVLLWREQAENQFIKSVSSKCSCVKCLCNFNRKKSSLISCRNNRGVRRINQPALIPVRRSDDQTRLSAVSNGVL